MAIRKRAGVLAGSCCALLTAAAHAQTTAEITASGRKVVQAVRTDTPPVIDGRLDDAAWEQAGVITDFHQIRPGDGTPTSEPTEVYLLYDDNAFYIGARLHDSDPALIAAPTMRHGQGLGPDDRLIVIFDPFNTGRSGYRFETNPNGVRHDALYQNINSFQADWSVIWDTAGQIDEQGWVSEMAIPFKSLPFDPSIDTWGFNFGRGIRRRGEEMAWVSRNRSMNPSVLGLVTGLSGMDQGMGLDVVPSMTVGRRRAFGAASGDGVATDTNPSVDVFYRFTPSLNGALTINTDFSATEVDSRQVNLTRFNLFFPEKRDFFLSDADLFQFGRISNDGASETNEAASGSARENARPFFSRRLGLSAFGQPVDIEYGGKVSGRVGRFSIGSLAIRQGEFSDVLASDLFVGRVTANVLEESAIGIILTDGDPASNEDNSVAGADFRFLNTRLPGGRVLEADAWYQRSDTPGLLDDDAAYGVGINMPNNAGFRGGVAIKTIEENFNPAMGFVSRDDVRDTAADIGYTRFFSGGRVQRLYSGIDAQRFNLLDGGLQSERILLRLFELESHTRDQVRMRYAMNKEIVDVPFDVYVDSSDPSRNVTIAPGSYSFDEASVRFSTGSQRRLSGSMNYQVGDFYNGTRTNVSSQFSWKPSRHFIMNLDYDWNDIDLPQGDFMVRVASVSTQVAFSSTLSWVTLMQYDNLSENLGINTRLHWIPEAGREGFIVLNHNLDDRDKNSSFHSVTADLNVKFKYTFRF